MCVSLCCSFSILPPRSLAQPLTSPRYEETGLQQALRNNQQVLTKC